MPDLFDQEIRLQRRSRAARMGPEDFLHRRALDDMIERLSMIRKSFESVLVLGCISRKTADEIRSMFSRVDLLEPSEILAEQLDAQHASDVELDVAPGSYDLLLSLNTVGESNDPLTTLMRMRFALAPGGLLLGALVGGDSLQTLRETMHAFDGDGGARPHVHPRIDPAGLTQLLAQAGLREPVVDVDRVEVRYGQLQRLVRDLRSMGSSNFLRERDRIGVDQRGYVAAQRHFATLAADDGKTSEFFDILHFAGWQEISEK